MMSFYEAAAKNIKRLLVHPSEKEKVAQTLRENGMEDMIGMLVTCEYVSPGNMMAVGSTADAICDMAKDWFGDGDDE